MTEGKRNHPGEFPGGFNGDDPPARVYAPRVDLRGSLAYR
jgi:hypothetical protein